MHYIPNSKAELNEVLQTIWTYAPDEYSDLYWPTPERPTMESDYKVLREGIDIVFKQKRFNDRRQKLKELVEESYNVFLSGDRKSGIEIISQIQIMVGKMK